jgi:aryl-alcohol dehydrogenase-like predicted oxidoreductase
MYKTAPADAWPDLLDSWVELGGNAIDTARQYGNAEAVVGRWLDARRTGESVAVFTKAGLFDPENGRSRVRGIDVAADVTQSRAALGLPTIPLLFLHRDDPSRPVSEIIDELQPLLRDGDIRALGASNWTTGRLDEARRYAEESGRVGFSCSSPNLSLAPPEIEPWPGCVSAHSAPDRAWYARSGLPVFAWSTLARGWFGEPADEHVERIFGTSANRERRRRASVLASRTGVKAAQIALAWVLRQSFPTFAVIGPRTVSELEECVESLDIELSEADAAWLNLEDGTSD